MIADPEIARSVSDLMLEIFRQVDESVAYIRARCSADEASAYQKATAPLAGAIVMNVLEPLYLQHPDLKPRNWD
jgi:hypothetical protein